MTNLIQPIGLSTVYDKQLTRSKVDHTLRKIFFTAVILLNLAALGAIYYALITYCPLPTEPILASSFLIGVLAGIASMKIPTGGVKSGNYTQFLNPIILVGRAASYVFFGPTLLLHKHLDWTNYAKGVEANRIFGELKQQKFTEIADTYGPHAGNLTKYGLMTKENAEALKAFYQEYVPLKLKKDYLLKYQATENPNKKELQEVETALATIETRWQTLQSNLEIFELEVKTPNFESRFVRWYRQYRPSKETKL